MLTRMLLGSFLTFSMLSLGALPAHAQNDDFYKQQTIKYLKGTDALKDLRGYHFAPIPDGIKTGYIKKGAGNFQDAVFHLEKGYAYAFVGQCDSDCHQLTFQLFNQDGDQIGSDQTNGDTPAIWLLVTHSGDYRIRATMPSCGGFFGCYWAVEAVSK